MAPVQRDRGRSHRLLFGIAYVASPLSWLSLQKGRPAQGSGCATQGQNQRQGISWQTVSPLSCSWHSQQDSLAPRMGGSRFRFGSGLPRTASLRTLLINLRCILASAVRSVVLFSAMMTSPQRCSDTVPGQVRPGRIQHGKMPPRIHRERYLDWEAELRKLEMPPQP